MKKGNKIWMIAGLVLIISLIGTSAAFARIERSQDAVVHSVIYTPIGGYVDPTPVPTPTPTPVPAEPDIECTRADNCSSWTGRWMITYLRKSEGHWVTYCQLYVPDFIDNEQDAKNWRWSDVYLAENCSLSDEPQTWEGIYQNIQKETISVPCQSICLAD